MLMCNLSQLSYTVIHVQASVYSCLETGILCNHYFCFATHTHTHLSFHQVARISIQTSREPRFKTLSKISNGLCQSTRYRTKNIRYEKIHDALIENVITSVQVGDDWWTARENDKFFFGDLLVLVIVD